VGIAVYFLIVAPIVFCALFVVIGLSSLSYGREPLPFGAHLPNLIWTLSIYALFGVIAGCSRSPDLRMIFCVAAHIGVLITETLPPVAVHDGMMSAFVLCGIFVAPFGWAWFVLVRDFFSSNTASVRLKT
jgi:hypothetical protein